MFGDTLTMGQTSATCWGLEPFGVDSVELVGFTRRMLSRTSCSVCARLSTPRWLNRI